MSVIAWSVTGIMSMSLSVYMCVLLGSCMRIWIVRHLQPVSICGIGYGTAVLEDWVVES